MPYQIGIPMDGSAVSQAFEPKLKLDDRLDLLRLLTRPTKLQAEEIESIPRTLIVGEPDDGPFPDILGWNLGPWIVSPRLHEIIETLEPSVHDFVPIHVVSENGSSDHGNYYIILLDHTLDAVNYEMTHFLFGTGFDAARSSNYMILPGPNNCVLNADAIRGDHLWRAPSPMHYCYFCSDELYDRIKGEGMRGWGFCACKAV